MIMHIMCDAQGCCMQCCADPPFACRYVWLNQYIGQFLPILALLALRVVVGIGAFLAKRFGKKKKDEMQEMADLYGKHRATEYNVGPPGSRRDTGVRYSDVAGIDTVKSDIEETMSMILGAPEFEAIGARPPRVSHQAAAHAAACQSQFFSLLAVSPYMSAFQGILNPLGAHEALEAPFVRKGMLNLLCLRGC